jgi:hypothetical protein
MGTTPAAPTIVNQLVATDTVGINLLLGELLKGAAFPLSKGPFTVAVADPQNTGVVVTAGSADQTSPTNFKGTAAGLALGEVTVTVTDESQTPPLVGVGSFAVVAPAPPPPPPGPDTLTVQFTPATPPAA